MQYKQIMLLAIFLVSLLAIGAVSAADNSTDNDVIGESSYEGLPDPVINDEGTFTQLDHAINGNTKSKITLNNDYKHSSEEGFVDGIFINRDLTIYGNGHTINAEGNARIFNIVGGNVVFYNITFTNGYNNDVGGAIYGNCKAINCTFKNNKADWGGGAMVLGTAFDCTFIENSAMLGGAMKDANAVNCIFTRNFEKPIASDIRTYYAYGGAMYGGHAVNCTFIENTGHGSYIRGGAMFLGSAVNCTFIKNYLSDYDARGGAAEGTTAVDCTFSGNYANLGNAMYNGYMWNCTGQVLSDFYGTGELALHWDVNDNFTAPYGGAIGIYLKNQNYALVGYINCDLVVYNDGAVVKTYHCLSNDALHLDLDVGTYTAVLKVTYPGMDPIAKEINITITKTTPEIDVSVSKATYSEVVVKVKSDAGGKYNVKIGGKSKNVVLKKGVTKSVVFTGLKPKKYTVSVKFAGDKNYVEKLVKKSVAVKKAAVKLSAPKKTFKKSVKAKQYVVTLKANKKKVMKNTLVTLKVNKKTYKIKTNKKGKAIFKITNLNKKGTFTAVVKYSGNKYYAAKTVKPKITVK